MSGETPPWPRRLPTPKDPGPADGFIETVTDVREITTGALFVNVDFNMLLADYSEEQAYEIVGRLKDLLG